MCSTSAHRSEIGVVRSKWRSAKAFCSWLGLCPANKISGGKVLDSRTRQVVNRVADALRLAAQSAGRTETCLGIFYRRKQAHLGAPKATTATARKLACFIYHLLKHKQPYQEPDPVIYQTRLKKSALTKLQRQAFALGYTLLPTSPDPPLNSTAHGSSSDKDLLKSCRIHGVCASDPPKGPVRRSGRSRIRGTGGPAGRRFPRPYSRVGM